MNLRIGIDATSWANGRGYGRFTREICHALLESGSEHSFHFFIEAQNASMLEHIADRAEIHPVDLDCAPTEAAGASSSRSLNDMLMLRRAVAGADVDVLYFPTVYTWFPVKKSQKVLLGIHDAIAERFPHLCFGNWKHKMFWNLKVSMAIQQCRLVLTISEHAKRDLMRVLKIPESKLRIGGAAPAATLKPATSDRVNRVSAQFGLAPDDSWFIYVGGFNPHKNVRDIVRALGMLKQSGAPRAKLLLVGTLDKDNFHGDQAQLARLIAELGLDDDVLWTGFVEDADMAPLMSGAVALILPSACEGYGLPAVEAAACGSTVIATTESPLPELLEGGGFFLAPGNVEELAQSMQQLLQDDDLRERMSGKAQALASAMSWKEIAERALAAIEEAAA